jgi:hypothetical protein
MRRIGQLSRALRIAVGATAAAAILATATTTLRAGTFGTRCQKSFQDPDLATLPYQYVRCTGFNNELDDSDTRVFYYDLTSGSGFTYNDGSAAAGGVDSVDLFYVATHGGAGNPLTAFLSLYQQGAAASSSTWRFGNNSRAVKIFSQYACETLKLTNGWERWVAAFKGGLYIATGSHDKIYDGETTDETGEDYADDLQDGKSVKWAWFDGNGDWYADQDVAVYASSSGSLDECKFRRDWMTWQNIPNFPRLRDGAMNRICASWIDNN